MHISISKPMKVQLFNVFAGREFYGANQRNRLADQVQREHERMIEEIKASKQTEASDLLWLYLKD